MQKGGGVTMKTLPELCDGLGAKLKFITSKCFLFGHDFKMTNPKDYYLKGGYPEVCTRCGVRRFIVDNYQPYMDKGDGKP